MKSKIYQIYHKFDVVFFYVLRYFIYLLF